MSQLKSTWYITKYALSSGIAAIEAELDGQWVFQKSTSQGHYQCYRPGVDAHQSLAEAKTKAIAMGEKKIAVNLRANAAIEAKIIEWKSNTCPTQLKTK